MYVFKPPVVRERLWRALNRIIARCLECLCSKESQLRSPSGGSYILKSDKVIAAFNFHMSQIRWCLLWKFNSPEATVIILFAILRVFLVAQVIEVNSVPVSSKRG